MHQAFGRHLFRSGDGGAALDANNARRAIASVSAKAGFVPIAVNDWRHFCQNAIVRVAAAATGEVLHVFGDRIGAARLAFDCTRVSKPFRTPSLPAARGGTLLATIAALQQHAHHSNVQATNYGVGRLAGAFVSDVELASQILASIQWQTAAVGLRQLEFERLHTYEQQQQAARLVDHLENQRRLDEVKHGAALSLIERLESNITFLNDSQLEMQQSIAQMQQMLVQSLTNQQQQPQQQQNSIAISNASNSDIATNNATANVQTSSRHENQLWAMQQYEQQMRKRRHIDATRFERLQQISNQLINSKKQKKN